MIFDTNVLIYLSKYILKPESLFVGKVDELVIVPLTNAVAEETIRLRAVKKVKLPDAIIYCTAMIEDLPLLTNNIADFKSLGNKVELINPFNL